MRLVFLIALTVHQHVIAAFLVQRCNHLALRAMNQLTAKCATDFAMSCPFR